MIWRGENPASTTPGVYFLAFILVSLLMFSVFSRWWPRRSASSPQISADLWDAVWRSLPFLHWMSPTEQALLRERSRELLGLKQINGAAGLVLNDHIRLSIALQAALPILHRGCEAYRNWAEIVVYPGDFIIPRQEVDENGVVHEYEETLLGEAWIEGRVHLTMQIDWNGRKVGRCDAGPDMRFHFGQLIAHAARTRRLRAGSIIGSGTVSNPGVEKDGRREWPKGYGCIAEKRAMETIQDGAPKTDYMRFGDTVRIEMKGKDGESVFGAIEQNVSQFGR